MAPQLHFTLTLPCLPACACSYYLLVSLSVLPAAAYAPLLTHAAGLLHASGSGLPPMQLPSPGWVVEQLAPVQLAGAAVFLAGNVLQWHSHWLLSRLAGRAKRTTYMIPRGGHGCAIV
jgi:hypothetical protein